MVLVDSEDVIEDIDVEVYSKLINSEVITETGEPLGRIRDFVFNIDDGKVYSLIIASLGIPQIPEQFISTYELPIEEIISSGPNRVIVFEGAEDRLTQLTEGILERFGICRPVWEREEEDELDSLKTVRPENQLPTGIPVRAPQKRQPVKTPVRQDYWEEEEWEEEVPAPPQKLKVLYRDYEEDGSGRSPARNEDYQDDNVDQDAWNDEVQSDPYKGPRISIPEKKKASEYEEEPR